MVGLSGKSVGATSRAPGGKGDKAQPPSFNPLAPFDVFGAGRAPSNMMEQWISLFPTAPLFGVRWAFFDMMQSASSGISPMFPMAANCAAPASLAPFFSAPAGLAPATKPAPARAEAVSHDVESATLDGVGAKTAKHLRLVPIEEKTPAAAKPKPAAAPAEAKLVERKTAEKKVAAPAKPAPSKPAAAKAVEAKSVAPKPAAAKPAQKATAKKNAGAPRGLMSAAPASPDDLKRIKGVGAKLEAVLNDLGVYTYAQIAGFSDAEFDWLDERLGVSRGRPRRDDWVGQASSLQAEKKKKR